MEMNEWGALFEQNADAVFIISQDAVIYHNKALAALLARAASRNISEAIYAQFPEISTMQAEGRSATKVRVEGDVYELTRALFSGVFVFTLKREDTETVETRFLEALCSELRQKLGTIQSAVEVLEATEDESALRVLRKSQYQLERMCSQVEYFSHFKRQNVSLKVAQVDMVAFLQTRIETIKHLVKDKQISISFQADSKEAMLWIDKQKMEQALYNILTNSIRALEGKGEIQIKLSEKSDGLALTFSDNGIGIATDAYAHLFKSYNRSLLEKGRRGEGFGVGLYITEAIIKAHGGVMVVNSAEGKGTTLAISLPGGMAHLTQVELQQVQPGYLKFEEENSVHAMLTGLSEILGNDAFALWNIE